MIDANDNVSDVKDTINILCATDDGYAVYCDTMLYSLLLHSADYRHYHIKIVDFGVTDEHKNFIVKDLENVINGTNKKLTLEFVNPVDYTPTHESRYHKATYQRLFITDFFQGSNKALYIDVDMILLDDISKIYDEFDVENAHKELSIASVPDTTMLSASGLKETLYNLYFTKHLGTKLNTKTYFNAGLTIFNLQKLSSTSIIKLFENNRLNGKELFWLDQDMLNSIFEGSVHYLDKRWNMQSALILPNENVESVKNIASLIHYTGDKPLHNHSINLVALFMKYYENTTFYKSGYVCTSKVTKLENKLRNRLKFFQLLFFS